MQDLNRILRERPALHAKDRTPDGFAWIIMHAPDISVFAFRRSSGDPQRDLMPVSMAIAAPVSSAIGLTATFVLAGLLPVPIAWAFYFAARMWRDEIEHPLVDETPPKLVPVND